MPQHRRFFPNLPVSEKSLCQFSTHRLGCNGSLFGLTATVRRTEWMVVVSGRRRGMPTLACDSSFLADCRTSVNFSRWQVPVLERTGCMVKRIALWALILVIGLTVHAARADELTGKPFVVAVGINKYDD